MYDYAKHLKWAKLKVGIVITAALLIVFLAIMFAGDIEKVFAPKSKINAIFNDVKGLRKGSPVWFSGVEIGAVKSINFTVQQSIKVEMMIQTSSLEYLKKDSKANILTLGLLGDKYVEIAPGSKEGDELKAGNTIMGTTNTEFQDVIETGEKSIAKISDFVGMLEEVLTKIERGEGTVAKFIQDPAVYNNLKDVLGELNALLTKVESGKGTVGRLLNEDDLYTGMMSSVEDIKLFADNLKGSEGTLHKLINDPSLYDRFQSASESLDVFAKRMELSKGTFAKLIEDDSLYYNINSVSGKLDKILEQVERGDGLMGSLVKDQELSSDIKLAVKELNLLLKDIKNHPGKYFRFSIF
jgi:phospholipid/cholesterol/gamma-HCH transport system substrate-binding protein